MLVELSSPVFKEKGELRDIIRFHEGLNVILGKEDGENSIGKSSALLAIDFAFGGESYITSDGVKHMGHHPSFSGSNFRMKTDVSHERQMIRTGFSYVMRIMT